MENQELLDLLQAIIDRQPEGPADIARPQDEAAAPEPLEILPQPGVSTAEQLAAAPEPLEILPQPGVSTAEQLAAATTQEEADILERRVSEERFQETASLQDFLRRKSEGPLTRVTGPREVQEEDNPVVALLGAIDKRTQEDEGFFNDLLSGLSEGSRIVVSDAARNFGFQDFANRLEETAPRERTTTPAAAIGRAIVGGTKFFIEGGLSLALGPVLGGSSLEEQFGFDPGEQRDILDEIRQVKTRPDDFTEEQVTDLVNRRDAALRNTQIFEARQILSELTPEGTGIDDFLEGFERSKFTILANVAAAFGDIDDFETANRLREIASTEQFDAQSAYATAGEIGAQSIPSAAALLIGGPVAAGLMGAFYFTQGLGSGRTVYRDIKEKTGEEVKFIEEMTLGIGFGLAEMLTERFGLKVLENISTKLAFELGEKALLTQIRKGTLTQAQIVAMSKWTVATMGAEAYEEAVNSVAQTTMISMFDPETGVMDQGLWDFTKDLTEDALISAAGGALGGGFVGPAARFRGRQNIRNARRELNEASDDELFNVLQDENVNEGIRGVAEEIFNSRLAGQAPTVDGARLPTPQMTPEFREEFTAAANEASSADLQRGLLDGRFTGEQTDIIIGILEQKPSEEAPVRFGPERVREQRRRFAETLEEAERLGQPVEELEPRVGIRTQVPGTERIVRPGAVLEGAIDIEAARQGAEIVDAEEAVVNQENAIQIFNSFIDATNLVEEEKTRFKNAIILADVAGRRGTEEELRSRGILSGDPGSPVITIGDQTYEGDTAKEMLGTFRIGAVTVGSKDQLRNIFLLANVDETDVRDEIFHAFMDFAPGEVKRDAINAFNEEFDTTFKTYSEGRERMAREFANHLGGIRRTERGGFLRGLFDTHNRAWRQTINPFKRGDVAEQVQTGAFTDLLLKIGRGEVADLVQPGIVEEIVEEAAEPQEAEIRQVINEDSDRRADVLREIEEEGRPFGIGEVAFQALARGEPTATFFAEPGVVEGEEAIEGEAAVTLTREQFLERLTNEENIRRLAQNQANLEQRTITVQIDPGAAPEIFTPTKLRVPRPGPVTEAERQETLAEERIARTRQQQLQRVEEAATVATEDPLTALREAIANQDVNRIAEIVDINPDAFETADRQSLIEEAEEQGPGVAAFVESQLAFPTEAVEREPTQLRVPVTPQVDVQEEAVRAESAQRVSERNKLETQRTELINQFNASEQSVQDALAAFDEKFPTSTSAQILQTKTSLEQGEIPAPLTRVNRNNTTLVAVRDAIQRLNDVNDQLEQVETTIGDVEGRMTGLELAVSPEGTTPEERDEIAAIQALRLDENQEVSLIRQVLGRQFVTDKVSSKSVVDTENGTFRIDLYQDFRNPGQSIAFVEGTIVEDGDDPHMQITSRGTERGFRGRGFGSQLLDEAFQEATFRNIPLRSDNNVSAAAVRTFRRFGEQSNVDLVQSDNTTELPDGSFFLAGDNPNYVFQLTVSSDDPLPPDFFGEDTPLVENVEEAEEQFNEATATPDEDTTLETEENVVRLRMEDELRKTSVDLQGPIPSVVRRDDPKEGQEDTIPDGVQSSEEFAQFFADTVRAEDGGAQNVEDPLNASVMDTEEHESIYETYESFQGNFDTHISTSIPGFVDAQVRVVDALSKILEEGSEVLDIGAGENTFLKTLQVTSRANDRRIEGLGIDSSAAMRDAAKKRRVRGIRFRLSAWGESFVDPDTGRRVKVFEADDGTYDLVYEGMTFQFISDDRSGQLDEVVRIMKDDGLFVTLEKFNQQNEDTYFQQEKAKDAFKLLFYEQSDIDTKKKTVLGNAASREGMRSNMVDQTTFENLLLDRFEHVAQIWSSGNFSGYIATNDRAKFDAFISNLSSTNSDFAVKQTPHLISDSPAQRDGLNTAQRTQEQEVETTLQGTPVVAQWTKQETGRYTHEIDGSVWEIKLEEGDWNTTRDGVSVLDPTRTLREAKTLVSEAINLTRNDALQDDGDLIQFNPLSLPDNVVVIDTNTDLSRGHIGINDSDEYFADHMGHVFRSPIGNSVDEITHYRRGAILVGKVEDAKVGQLLDENNVEPGDIDDIDLLGHEVWSSLVEQQGDTPEPLAIDPLEITELALRGQRSFLLDLGGELRGQFQSPGLKKALQALERNERPQEIRSIAEGNEELEDFNRRLKDYAALWDQREAILNPITPLRDSQGNPDWVTAEILMLDDDINEISIDDDNTVVGFVENENSETLFYRRNLADQWESVEEITEEEHGKALEVAEKRLMTMRNEGTVFTINGQVVADLKVQSASKKRKTAETAAIKAGEKYKGKAEAALRAKAELALSIVPDAMTPSGGPALRTFVRLVNDYRTDVESYLRAEDAYHEANIGLEENPEDEINDNGRGFRSFRKDIEAYFSGKGIAIFDGKDPSDLANRSLQKMIHQESMARVRLEENTTAPELDEEIQRQISDGVVRGLSLTEILNELPKQNPQSVENLYNVLASSIIGVDEDIDFEDPHLDINDIVSYSMSSPSPRVRESRARRVISWFKPSTPNIHRRNVISTSFRRLTYQAAKYPGAVMNIARKVYASPEKRLRVGGVPRTLFEAREFEEEKWFTKYLDIQEDADRWMKNNVPIGNREKAWGRIGALQRQPSLATATDRDQALLGFANQLHNLMEKFGKYLSDEKNDDFNLLSEAQLIQFDPVKGTRYFPRTWNAMEMERRESQWKEILRRQSLPIFRKRIEEKRKELNAELLEAEADLQKAIDKDSDSRASKRGRDLVDIVKNNLQSLDGTLDEFIDQIFNKITKGDTFAYDKWLFSDKSRLIREMLDTFPNAPRGIHAKQRKLWWINENEFAQANFLADDPRDALPTYLRNFIRQREYIRRFGRSNQELEITAKEMEIIGKAKGYDSKTIKSDIEEFKRIMEGLAGVLHIENIARYHGADKVIRLSHTLSVMSALTFTGVTSFIETAAIPLRFGFEAAALGLTALPGFAKEKMGVPVRAFMKGIGIMVPKHFGRSQIMEMGRMVAVISHHTINTLIDERALGYALDDTQPNSKAAKYSRKLIRGFYKINLVAPITELQRVMSAVAAQRHITRLFRKPRSKLTTRELDLLEILNLKNDFDRLREVWRSNKANLFRIRERESQEDFETFQTAIYRAVNQAITKPNAATKPVWGNSLDPILQAVYSLKSFSDGFREGAFAFWLDRMRNGDWPEKFSMMVRFLNLLFVSWLTESIIRPGVKVILGADAQELKEREERTGRLLNAIAVIDKTGFTVQGSNFLGAFYASKYGRSPESGVVGPGVTAVSDVAKGFYVSLDRGDPAFLWNALYNSYVPGAKLPFLKDLATIEPGKFKVDVPALLGIEKESTGGGRRRSRTRRSKER